MSNYKNCDGTSRRDFIRIGGLATGGLSLASYLNMANAGVINDGGATSGIFIDLNGGPSHIDTFDPKPDASQEIRGEFGTVATNVAAVSYTHLTLPTKRIV